MNSAVKNILNKCHSVHNVKQGNFIVDNVLLSIQVYATG